MPVWPVSRYMDVGRPSMGRGLETRRKEREGRNDQLQQSKMNVYCLPLTRNNPFDLDCTSTSCCEDRVDPYRSCVSSEEN